MTNETFINDIAVVQEPKIVIHPNVNKFLDIDSEQQLEQHQQDVDLTPKSSVCSNLCTNLFSILKKNKPINECEDTSKKNINNSSSSITTDRIINKIFLENSISSSNTSCDSIDISFFQRQNQIMQESGNNKRKIFPDYRHSNSNGSSTSLSNDSIINETYLTTTNNHENDNISQTNIEHKSKDTIDEAIKNLGLNLSQISTNFDSLSIEMKNTSENTSATHSDLSLNQTSESA